MELTHDFEVPVGIEDAWRILTDIERVAPCMPGATVEPGDEGQFRGSMKVKVGPIQLTYRGTAEFVERDGEAHRAVLEANGQEARGSGTARATITATCTEVAPGTTAVSVVTDLAVTGRPAQFGRGVLADVGDKLLGRFADCLAEEVAGGNGSGREEEEPSAPRPDASDRPGDRRPVTRQPLDLLEVAGGPVGRRLVPVAIALALLAAIWWYVRR
ncbi:MAG: SRPBCC family protein [Nitriliruptorales bacterium]|nr:SRPBCC family protein [Nitriliruptorales bacterium]